LTFPAGNYPCCGEFLQATGAFKSLANVVWVVYFDVDEKENYQWKAMEWAHP